MSSRSNKGAAEYPNNISFHVIFTTDTRNSCQEDKERKKTHNISQNIYGSDNFTGIVGEELHEPTGSYGENSSH